MRAISIPLRKSLTDPGHVAVRQEGFLDHGEEALVAEAQKGNLTAFANIYEQYYEKIYRYIVVRIGNPADAEDLAGDVFLKALEAIGSFRSRGVPFSAWLFRIAHNVAVDHLRKRKRHETNELDQALAVPGPGFEETVEVKLAMEGVASVMSDLTELQRQVIALRFAAELSVAETGHVLQRKEGAVKALQHSAIQALRRAISRESEARSRRSGKGKGNTADG